MNHPGAFRHSGDAYATKLGSPNNRVVLAAFRQGAAGHTQAIKPALQQVGNFIELDAGIWGARRDVANRVAYAAQQAVEAVIEFGHIRAPAILRVSYDEFDIDY